MICKLTKQEGKPVDAHIIPESFFEIDPNEKGVTQILKNNSDTYPKRESTKGQALHLTCLWLSM
jgi:hypothetical protein